MLTAYNLPRLAVIIHQVSAESSCMSMYIHRCYAHTLGWELPSATLVLHSHPMDSPNANAPEKASCSMWTAVDSSMQLQRGTSPALLNSVDMLYSKHMYFREAHVQRKGCQLTLSTCMAFISSTRPSKEVLRISGGVCAGKVSLKCADEYSLQAADVVYVLAE